MSRTLKIALLAGAAVVIALAGSVYWFILRDDAPPPAALRTRPDVTLPAAASSGSTGTSGDVNGTWIVQTGDQVFVGYRMQERFGGDTVEKTAVGRTPAVTGTMQIDGNKVTNASFKADLTQLSSDQVRRDRYIKNTGLESDKFPTATFTLSEPIALDSPTPGKVVEVDATGDLTVHGVTKRVTIPLTTRWNGDSIDIAGETDVVLADYGISAPAVGGFVSVADHGKFEEQLTFVRQ